jgi:hypothetical protein
VQGESGAFGIGERGSFIEQGIADQVEAGEMRSESVGHRGRLALEGVIRNFDAETLR